MRDEIGNDHMKEFVGISSKVYASKQYVIDGTIKEDKKARGTNKNVVKKTLSFDRCLNSIMLV